MIRFLAFLDRHAGLLIAALALLLALAVFASCTEPPRPTPPPAPPPVEVDPSVPAPAPGPESTPAERVAYWQSRAISLDAAAGQARAELLAARQEISQAPLRSAIRWATWAGGIVAIAGGVLALLLGLLAAQFPILARIPFGWKTATWISLCGVAAVALAQGLAAVLPWAGLAGMIILGLGVLVGVTWVAATWRRGGQATAAEWQRYAQALPADLRVQLDQDSRSLQGSAAQTVSRLLSRV
jgi:hypothetical protein